MRARLRYLVLTCCTIIVGIGSRQAIFIPLFMGDLLYAVMMYFLVRTFIIQRTAFTAYLIATLCCVLIECSQLLQFELLQKIRSTLPGRLILGQGFLWSDLLAYIAGTAIAFFLDRCAVQKAFPKIS